MPKLLKLRMNPRSLLMLIAVSFSMLTTVQAQNENFDLAGQRSEVQLVNPVPGEKRAHQEFVINPTPRYMRLTGEGSVDIGNGIKAIVPKADSLHNYLEDMYFLPILCKCSDLYSKGFPLEATYGEVPTEHEVQNVSGAYSLKISKNGIQIIGYDDAGIFYAIQTLRLIMDNPAAKDGKSLPCLEVVDSPTFPYRGVVEGFYGTPWSHKVRLSLIDFYGKYKLNTYIYGPKDDPYHSSPNWRLPYPDAERKNIKELVEACRKNRVDFVWAIHPGKDIKWNEEDYQNLVHKFELMYADGVRSFAIFFDDIEGEGTNPEKQVELLNRLTEEFVKPKGDVSPLIVCPTDYSKLWAKAGEDGPLSIYGRKLDPSIRVFWTGDVVCSDVTRATLDWVNSRIKRPAFFWWNYPVTDYVRNLMLQGPVYGLDTSLTSKDMCGFVSNPMEHGEASKLALYSVADYSWNASDYNPIDSWERGLEVMMPCIKSAYRTFAIHSSDTETGYRRDESWETETFRLADYTQEKRDKLYNEFDSVALAPAEIEAGCTDSLLLVELRPWLKEFGKLGVRGQNAIDLMDLYRAGGDKRFWNAYVRNCMTAEDRKEYEAHKSGTMKLQPFYEQAMADLADAFYERLTGEKAFRLQAIGTYPNVRTTQTNMMLDGDTATFYTSGVSQKAGDWVGVALPELTTLRKVHILQGRNSKDDTDFFDHAALEYSVDGKTWQPLLDDLRNQYDILWRGDPVQARYIRLRRLDSERTNWASIREFSVFPATKKSVNYAKNSSNPVNLAKAFDHQLTTFFHSPGAFSFDVPKKTISCTLLLSVPEGGSVILRQYDKHNNVRSETTTTDSFINLNIVKGVTHIGVVGTADVNEIILKEKH